MSPSPAQRHPGRRRVGFTMRPQAVLAIVVVVGLFLTGAIVGGLVGGIIIGVLAVTAGALLVARWSALPPPVRIFRLAAVLIALGFAIVVATRGG